MRKMLLGVAMLAAGMGVAKVYADHGGTYVCWWDADHIRMQCAHIME